MRIQNIGQTQKKTITGEFIGIDSMTETDRDAISPEAGDIALVEVDMEFHDNTRRQRLMHLRSTVNTFADHFFRFFTSGTTLISALSYVTEGNFDSVAGVVGAPGVLQMRTNLAAGSRCILALGQATNSGYVSFSDIREISANVSHTISTQGFYIPIGASQNRTIAPANTVYFRISTGDLTRKAVAVQGGVTTVIDTLIAPTPGQFKRFVIRPSSISIRYYIDDVLVATIPTTMVLSTQLNPGCFLQNLLGGTARLMQVDHFYIETISG